jgi:hypothetical protein
MVDESRLYWISGTSYVALRISIGPKNGSEPSTVLVDGQNQLASFALDGGFVYWTTSTIIGSIARCPREGCGAHGPELLADREPYAHYIVPSNGVLTWMNGPTPAGRVGRSVEIRDCKLPDCEATIASLDRGIGSGYAVVASGYTPGVDMALPPREMVVDDDAIYWFGDVVDLAPGNPDVLDEVDASLRRTEKRPRP